MIKLIAGMSSGDNKPVERCVTCNRKLPEYWVEGFCSIECFQGKKRKKELPSTCGTIYEDISRKPKENKK